MKKDITVSIWSHPDWSQTLVLEGTPETTKATAAMYAEKGTEEALQCVGVDAMTRTEIGKLEEFSG